MRCPWNINLTCWIKKNDDRVKDCPIRDYKFVSELEFWAFCNRTPKSADLNAEHLDGRASKNGYDDYRQVKMAEVYSLFKDGTAVCDIVTGKIEITQQSCKDMISGRAKWLSKNNV